MMNLNPSQKNVGELFAGRLFRIPPYQRAYSWGAAQRQDLFNDIREAHQKERQHFMATVVTRKTDTRSIAGDAFDVVDIIDGQQRITTLVILFKAIAQALSGRKGEGEAIARKIEELLVKGDDYQAVLLQTNHASSTIFSDYIKKGVVPKVEPRTAADRNLMNAMRDCEAFVTESDGIDAADIYYRVRNHFVSIYHQIDEEAIVYRVFETLNSRGLSVKWLDKTKSQLMALLFEHANGGHVDALGEMREVWRAIYDTLGLEVVQGDEAMRFAGTWKEPRCPNKLLGDQEASRRLVKAAGTSAKETVAAARWLQKVVEVHDTVMRDTRLDAVTRIRHARFVATAIKLRALSEEDTEQLMSKWENVTFRIYGLAGKDGRTRVGDYVRLGHAIVNETLTVDVILARLDKIGEGFEIEKVLKQKGFWSNCYEGWTAELRYILYRYEEHLAEEEGTPLDSTSWNKIWAADASRSIEHISPQSAGKSFVHELGNLTMLTPGLNSTLAAKPPLEKAEKYTTVGLRATAQVGRQIEKKGAWGKADVTERTQKIAAFVGEHWGG